MAFYEEYAAHRDLFEIIAIHDQRVKSFAELDQRLASIRKRHWQGKDLPFPVLIDGEGKTHRLYGIQGWPTTVLIDPEGVLVGRVSLAELRAKLPPLSPSQTWARQRDLGNNLFWDVEPGRFTLTLLATVLERWSHCQIEIDTEAVEASGLKADAPLPGVVYGNPITLRSIEELLLAAHGLGLAPAPDGEKLLLTKRPQLEEAPSYSQQLRAKELSLQLDRSPTTGTSGDARPLELEEVSLLDAIKLLQKEFRLPLALDAKAMREGRLDPAAQVADASSQTTCASRC